MRLSKIVITFLALFMLLLASSSIALFYSPDRSLNFIASNFFNSEQLAIKNIQGAKLRLDGLTIDALELIVPNYKANGNTLNIAYDLPSLAKGRIHDISLKELIVELIPNDETGVAKQAVTRNEQTSLESMLTLVANQPFDQLNVLSLTAALPTDQIHGSIKLSSKPSSIEAEFRAASIPSFILSIDSSISVNEPLLLSLKLVKDSQPAIQTTATVTVDQDSLSLSAVSQLDVQELIALGLHFNLLPPLSSATRTLQLSSNLRISNLMEAPSLESFDSIISNQVDLTQLSIERESQGLKIDVKLPIHLQTDHSNTQAWPDLTIDSIELALSANVLETQLGGKLDVSNLSLSCTQTFSCSGKVLLEVHDITLQASDWAAEQITIKSLVEATAIDGRQTVSSVDTQLRLVGGAFEDTTTSFTATLAQWEIENSKTETLTALAQFELQDWSLAYGSYTLNKPQVSGNLTFAGNELNVTLEGGLPPNIKASSKIEANLENSSGNIAFDLPPFSIDLDRPISSYVSGLDSGLDIIDGEIAATGITNWHFDSDGVLNFSGPISLEMNDISGVYDDYYFLGLSSNLSAEMTSPLGLKTKTRQTARIATAEVGLAINDISWDYEFDSTDSSLAIAELTGNLLGGQIIVPEARFKDFTSDTELTVVISDLDMNLITALAEYPELQVAGFVSGYLPINLRDGEITMRDGLVSALSPGGSIRYTPLTPSNNSSVKLVNDALSNYQFKTLDSELFYDELGDLNMKVELRGGNPDMIGGQQINLNLNIVNNVPDMLESLRASRTISDALEQRLQHDQ